MMWEGLRDRFSGERTYHRNRPGIDAAPVAPACAGATAFFAKRLV